MPDEQPQQVLTALLQLNTQVSEIKTNLAVNTTETANIVKRLDILNGSVSKHEANIALNAQAIALLTQTLSELKTHAMGLEKTKSSWLEWLFKGLIVLGLVVIYNLLIHANILSPLIYPH